MTGKGSQLALDVFWCGVRRRPTRAPHQVQALLGMRDTQHVLAQGGFAEGPPVEARGENSQKVEAVPQTRVEEAVLRTSETSPSGAADTQHQTSQQIKQQVPGPSGRSVASTPSDLLIPPSR